MMLRAKATATSELAIEKYKAVIEAQNKLDATPKAYVSKKGTYTDGYGVKRKGTVLEKSDTWKEAEETLEKAEAEYNKLINLQVNFTQQEKQILAQIGNQAGQIIAGSVEAAEKELARLQELYKKAGSDKERASLKKQIEAQQKEVNRISLTSKKEKDPYLEMLTKRKEKYADYLKWVTSKDETLRKAANTEFATLLKEGTSYLDYLEKKRADIQAKATKTTTDLKNLSTLNNEIAKTTKEAVISDFDKKLQEELAACQTIGARLDLLEQRRKELSGDNSDVDNAKKDIIDDAKKDTVKQAKEETKQLLREYAGYLSDKLDFEESYAWKKQAITDKLAKATTSKDKQVAEAALAALEKKRAEYSKLTVNDLTTQIDGKIESWFQSSDPAANWTTTALKKAHVGDMWYSSTTKLLKRYTVSGSTYSWTTIEDQKAIDAYTAASKAQDTADGKRQVFVAQPKPPYDIGDLWLTGGKTDGILKRCITKRTSGSYVANDWVEAVYYDNTQTTIDGGIVTAGTVQLAGSDASIKAGITGEGTADTSVRFWAGASKGNRATAPFRVLQDGSFVATKGTITGTINANAGSIGGFAIASGRIGVAASSGDTSGSGLALLSSFIKFSDSYRWASIGTNVLPASTGLVGVGRFTNKTPNSYGTNYGLLIEASGAMVNLGIVSKGAIVCDSYVADYGISKLLPSVNTCLTPGDATKPTLFKLMPRFIYSNSGIGLPRRDSICTVLGISNYTAFAVRITIICDRTSTQTGYVCGRNTFVKNSSGGNAMDSNYYPYRMNNNAGNETGKWNMAAGDIREFLLVWDGSSGYYAYLLNIRE